MIATLAGLARVSVRCRISVGLARVKALSQNTLMTNSAHVVSDHPCPTLIHNRASCGTCQETALQA